MINGIEFKDHDWNGITGSYQGSETDLLDIVKREVVVSKYVDEPESLVERDPTSLYANIALEQIRTLRYIPSFQDTQYIELTIRHDTVTTLPRF